MSNDQQPQVFLNPQMTNKNNMPDILFHAMAYSTHAGRDKPPNRISVTEILDSPQVVWLKRKHKKDIKYDASDSLFAMLGSAGHEVFANAALAMPERYVLEKPVVVQFGDWIISGRVDALDYLEASVDDFKFTSVFSFLLGSKPEWQAQLNIYAYLLRNWGWTDKNGDNHKFVAQKAKIVAVLRDWQKTKAMQQHDYPKTAFHVVPIRLFSDDAMKNWLTARLEQHALTRATIDTDNPVMFCDEQQRWAKPTTFAVKEPGKARARRVLNTEHEAEQWIFDQIDKNTPNSGTFYIETRLGENVRCERFCPVRQWCPQYNKMYRKDPVDADGWTTTKV